MGEMSESEKPLCWGPEVDEAIEKFDNAEARGETNPVDMTEILDKLEEKLEQDKMKKDAF